MMMIIMHFFHSNKNEASSPVYVQNKRQSILDCLFILYINLYALNIHPIIIRIKPIIK